MSESAATKETLPQRVADGLSRWSLRWVPDAWVIVVLLTFVVFVLAFFLSPGDYSIGKAEDLVRGWGDGFWALLEFGMQMALIILTGYVVATSPPFRRFLTWVADKPKGPKSAVAVMAATSMLLVLINWGLGLVGSAVLVRYMAVRQPKVDYRLLVACAYLGMAGTWHAGLSASSPLLVATPGHFAEEYFGVIPVTQTIFSAFNLLMVLIAILLHGTPRSLLRAAERGGNFMWGVVIQFPFYAGILGMITATGFSERIADWFTSIANEQTFPVLVYWYSGILNFFVPSGGSKFAIEASYLAEAADKLGVPLDLTVLAYAWGDMATDAIQPFWALPLLAIARLGFRDVMGFLLAFFVVYAAITSIGFLVAPLFF